MKHHLSCTLSQNRRSCATKFDFHHIWTRMHLITKPMSKNATARIIPLIPLKILHIWLFRVEESYFSNRFVCNLQHWTETNFIHRHKCFVLSIWFREIIIKLSAKITSSTIHLNWIWCTHLPPTNHSVYWSLILKVKNYNLFST